jgi:hypothetical protein
MAVPALPVWQELFGHDIDVRAQIIRPVLRQREKDWHLNVPKAP